LSKEQRNLIILHTNDIHSHFEQMPKISAYFRSVREAAAPDTVLALDIGDHMDRARPETEGTGGVANIELMNATGYDAMALGNNEGLTFTPQQMREAFSKHARFPVVGSNIVDMATGAVPDWMVPTHIVRRAGLTIGLIGVTAAFAAFYELLGWQVGEPLAAVAAHVGALRPQVDVLIVMSHLGLPLDQRMAAEVAGIDVILGGHTHHVLEEPLRIGSTWLGAAGKFGQYAGRLDLVYDRSIGGVRELRGGLVELGDDAPVDSSVAALLDGFREASRLALDTEVARLKQPLHLDWYGESPLGNLLAAGIRRWTGADVGVVNAGQLLQGLKEGRVTRGRLLEICPGPINPCRLRLSGKELQQALEESLLAQFMQRPIRGFGFRGEVLGVLCLDGIDVWVDDRRPPYEKVVAASIGGAPLDPQREYTVGSIDMFTFGVGYYSLCRASRVEYLLPEFIRDVLAVELRDEEALRVCADERIHRLGGESEQGGKLGIEA